MECGIWRRLAARAVPRPGVRAAIFYNNILYDVGNMHSNLQHRRMQKFH